MPPEPEILEMGRGTSDGDGGSGRLLGDARQDRDQRLQAEREIDVRVALGRTL